MHAFCRENNCDFIPIGSFSLPMQDMAMSALLMSLNVLPVAVHAADPAERAHGLIPVEYVSEEAASSLGARSRGHREKIRRMLREHFQGRGVIGEGKGKVADRWVLVTRQGDIAVSDRPCQTMKIKCSN